jgi:gliding motility-associated-like protein
LESLPQQDLDIQYYRNQEDAALKINEILPQTSYTNETANDQRLFARIESLDNGECVSVGEYVQLKVNPLPEFETPSEAIYCQNIGELNLTVSQPQGIYSYEWIDASGQVISNSENAVISRGGTYTVTGTSDLNCRSKVRVIDVKESSFAEISQNDITVVDGEEQNSISIDPTNLGPGVYEYALDNSLGPYQDEPFFDQVTPGEHTLYIRDKNGCGIAQIQVFVIGYMKFFTPNGDGFNDTWKVLGVTSQPMSNIYVYDKFGKLLTELDASDEEGWDGTFNGKQLPSSDYWYRVQLEDGRIHTGHFSLIRR